jgi:hypothetical protein
MNHSGIYTCTMWFISARASYPGLVEESLVFCEWSGDRTLAGSRQSGCAPPVTCNSTMIWSLHSQRVCHTRSVLNQPGVTPGLPNHRVALFNITNQWTSSETSHICAGHLLSHRLQMGSMAYLPGACHALRRLHKEGIPDQKSTTAFP